MNRALLAALVAAPLIAVPATALATSGPDHKTWVCHPVEGAGQNGYGWNLIAPDKASSHIDAYGVGKHTRKDGRTDVYAVAGKCPGSGNSSPPPSPSVSPSATPTVTASPSTSPSVTPSASPSVTPSATPSDSPSPTPSVTVTPTPTDTPSPSATPSGSATPTPSVTVTPTPTPDQTTDPTPQPTGSVTATTTPAPSTPATDAPAPATTTTAASQRTAVAHTDAEQLASTGSNTWLALLGLIGAFVGAVLVAAARKGSHR